MPKLIKGGAIPRNVLAFAKARWSKFIAGSALSQADVFQGFGILYKRVPVEKILIFPAALPPHILLSSGELFRAYNYELDRLSFVSNEAVVGPLSPIFNGRSQIQEKFALTFRNRWTEKQLNTGIAVDFLGGLNRYELAIFSTGFVAYGRTGDDFFKLFTYPHDRFLSFTSEDYIGFALRYSFGFEWNKMDTTVIYNYPMTTGVPSQSFIWTPSLFLNPPGEGQVSVGWFYGARNSWVIGDQSVPLMPDTPAGEGIAGIAAKVNLLAFMDSKGTNVDAFKFGYCEALIYANYDTGVDNPFNLEQIETPVLAFFASSTAADIQTENFFNWRSTVLLFNAKIRTGTTPLGNPDMIFTLTNPFGDGLLDFDVQMWGFSAWYDVNSIAIPPPTGDALGVFISNGSMAKFYRYVGTTENFFNTSNYHSHSVSTDGTTIAIFEGSDVIEKVTVFDLYGVRITIKEGMSQVVKEPSMYKHGGTTLLRESEVVAIGAKTGVLIPYRAKNAIIDAIPGGVQNRETTIEHEINGTYAPALGALYFFRAGIGPIDIEKIAIKNGREAILGFSYDRCGATSTIVIDKPFVGSTAHLVSQWSGGGGPGSLGAGKIRGVFFGSLDDGEFFFEGEGVGEIDIVTMPEHFIFVEQIGAPFWYAENYSGRLEVEGPFDAPEDCNDVVEYDKWIAETDCGQRETIIDTVDPPSSISIEGDFDVNVGDVYVGSGGIEDKYVFSFDSGSINPTTGEITDIDDCGAPGDSRSGVVSITDGCTTADKAVRLPDGAWIEQSNTPGGFTAVCYNDGWPDCQCCRLRSTTFCGGGSEVLSTGFFRYTEVWRGIEGCAQACSAFVVCPCTDFTPDLTPFTTNPIPTCGTGGQLITNQIIEEWLCP